MSAPKGNQFWKLADASKLGRPADFCTPEDLWQKTCQYFQECEDNPINVSEITTSEKGIFTKVLSHKVPYTWEGLYSFLEVCNLDHYKTKEEFSGIITHIGNVIRNQKFTGAAVGIFNANIIARELGLSDRTESKINASISDDIDYDKLSDSALEEIANARRK